MSYAIRLIYEGSCRLLIILSIDKESQEYFYTKYLIGRSMATPA